MYEAKIEYTGSDQLIFSKNLTLADEAPHILTQDLENWIAHHYLIKISSLSPKLICSPLGLVPKSNRGWQQIHQLFYPPSRSVNDFIPQKWGALEYLTFNNAIKKIVTHGPRYILVKQDLTDAFQHVPAAKNDRWLLALQWNDLYWVECFLPFGLRTLPFLFKLFGKRINWIIIKKRYNTLYYLDNFLAILDSEKQAAHFSQDFARICNKLEVSINKKKGKKSFILEFLGIELDTIAMEARLFFEKLQKAKNLVATVLTKYSLT